ncbi:MAG: DUF1731 domain-containing protein [Bacteroidetes bacterium]|nr:DUF1731 domain-containing protein [Bacteroidota bacterium]MDA1224739.1 DUF1731 domain-containing protein [Bacteroidota bacterium]
MKIIITGASGLIGKRLCKVLKQDGFDIEFLKRYDYNNTIEEKDWLSRKNIFWSNPEILENADAVVHLAGANVGSSWTKKYKKEILNSRKLGTDSLMKACADCQIPPKHIISASGIGFYPENTHQLLNETSESGNTFLAEVCKIWEQGIFEHKIPGAVASCLRTGIVISNNSKVFSVSQLQFQIFGMVGSVGSPNNLWSWIHINDLCSMYLALIKGTMSPGIYNAVAPHPCTQKAAGIAFEKFAPQRELKKSNITALLWRIPCAFNKMLKALRITARPVLPAFLIKLAWGERSAIALTNQNVSAKKTLDTGFCYQYPTIESAMDQLHTHNDC